MIRVYLLLSLFLIGVKSFAYPNYISYGYQSCMSCHFNPMGNGPLTDYGRSVAATELTDRLLWPESIRNDDEKLADKSGFFFGKSPINWLRPSASYRGLYYNMPGSGQPSKWINMDASAALVAKFFNNDKLIIVGQVSYAPRPVETQGDGKAYSEMRSREHYIGYRFTKSFGVYAGLMDKAFGIRVPDHITFSRILTRNDQDDQTHGVLLHYLQGNTEIALQPFVGNLVQEKNVRQQGYTTQIGYRTGETTRLGASYSSSKSDFATLNMYSLDARTGFGKGNSLLVEVGQTMTKPELGDSVTNRYVFLQNQWLLHRGLSSIITAEMMQPDIHANGEIYRFGPGIQYFPTYRMELRADIYDTRTHSSTYYTDDTWMVTGQVHLWF